LQVLERICLATTSVKDLLNFRLTNRVFHYEATKRLRSVQAPVNFFSEESMATFLAFLRTRIDLMFPFTAFGLQIRQLSIEGLSEFGVLVGKKASYYFVYAYLYGNTDLEQRQDGHKLALLLSYSPNISKLNFSMDCFLTTEDLALIPFFPRLKVRNSLSYSQCIVEFYS